MDAFGSYGTLGKFVFGDIGNPLKIVMARVTEMSGSETEKYGHGTAISALVFQVVSSVFGAHLGSGHVAATSTYEFLGVVIVALARVRITLSLPAEVGLVTLETHVIGIPLEGEPRGVVIPSGPFSHDGVGLGQPLVLQPHQGLLFDVVVKAVDGIQKRLESFVAHFGLANGTISEAKRDSRSGPSFFQNFGTTLVMEYMAALELNGRNRPKGFGEANHAHVVGVLPQARGPRASVQTRQTICFVEDAAAKMSARENAGTS